MRSTSPGTACRHGFGPGRPGARRDAELLESLVEQTLEIMNNGGRLDEAIHSVEVLPTSPGCRICGRSTTSPSSSCTTSGASTAAGGRQPRHLEAGSRGGPGQRGGGPRRRAWRLGGTSPRAAQPAAPTAAGPTPKGTPPGGHLAEMAWLADPSDPAIADAASGVHHARRARDLDHGQGVFNWAARTSSPED